MLPQKRCGFLPRSILYLEKIVVALFVRDKEKYVRAFEKNLKRYSNEKSKLWGNRTLVFKCPKSRRPLKDYQDLIYMPFESIQVPVPRNYDSMLRQQYGDYMQIPQNEKGTIHGDLILSTDYTFDDPRRTQDK